MSVSTDPSAGGAPAADGVEPARPAHWAHAVMHCNLNTVDIERSAAFHMALFGLEPRMRSVSTDSDAASMGITGGTTASVTTFLYDLRGPRSAPALELVGWTRPPTAAPGPEHRPSSFVAIGFRVPALRIVEARAAALGISVEPVPGGLPVRGVSRPALRLTDPDGVAVEVVEIPPSASDPRRVALVSHERMRCTDVERTAAWYESIGWEVRARGTGEDGRPTVSLAIPEDPTFSLEFEQLPLPAGPNLAWSSNTQGLFRMALAVDDVHAAYTSLAAVGSYNGAFSESLEPVTMSMPDTPTGGFTVLFLADPDGAVVELVERPRNEVRRPSEPR